MTTEEAFCEPLYFAQLCHQIDEALNKTRKRGTTVLSHVNQAHSLLNVSDSTYPKKSEKDQIRAKIVKAQEHVQGLKSELTSMLQDVVLADAALISIATLINPGCAFLPSVSAPSKPLASKDEQSPAMVTSLVEEAMKTVEEDTGSSWVAENESFDSSSSVPMASGNEEEISMEEGSKKTLTPGAKRKLLPILACKICGVKFKYRLPLFKHLKEHTEHNINHTNYHLYVECNETTMNLDSITNEEKSTLGKELEVKMASKGTVYKNLLEGPMPDQKTFNCVVCQKVFNRPNKLVRHMQIHDPDRPRVSCKYCSRSFTRYDTMYYHIRTQHPNSKESNVVSDNSPQTRKKVEGGSMAYKCNICSSTFPLLSAFENHGCAGAEIQPEPMIRCIHCNQAFSSYDQLASHQVNDHQHSCSVCSKTFLHKAYLDVHMVIHSGPGTFQCQECEASFEDSESYYNHIKTHPRYTPYKCLKCRKTFVYPSQIVAHSQSCNSPSKAANKVSTVQNIPTESTMEVETTSPEEGEVSIDSIPVTIKDLAALATDASILTAVARENSSSGNEASVSTVVQSLINLETTVVSSAST